MLAISNTLDLGALNTMYDSAPIAFSAINQMMTSFSVSMFTVYTHFTTGSSVRSECVPMWNPLMKVKYTGKFVNVNGFHTAGTCKIP